MSEMNLHTCTFTGVLTYITFIASVEVQAKSNYR
jgi:hypothetical protein